MEKHKFIITQEVPFSGVVSIEGSSRVEAHIYLQNIIQREDNPLNHPELKGVKMAPDMESASFLTVVCSLEEPTPPKRRKPKKENPPIFSEGENPYVQ